MIVCPSCGAANRDGAQFCDSCGAALAEAAPVREVRKTVTVFFCDVSGSTALGERIDPESLRAVMARYFETAQTILERHGGSVEKFIGDAVMAVFGIPTAHEDDALRAVRAADELRNGLTELNDDLERSYGAQLALRIGVNTGEVVTGTQERLATGDAVNVAARLEQAAEPGDVLVGEETAMLVREAVELEAVAAIEAKGKAEPLRAWRLLSVKPGAEPRRGGAPMVGRERQRRLLEDALADVVDERSCRLVTVLGPAGVGKSRLVEEFLRSLEDATVARGRCLSYGEGVGYWPVTEVVKQLLAGGDGGAPAALGTILGDESAAGSPDEIAWAFRKLLEAKVAEHLLVVVFDDIHWGEPPFLDLIEYIADLSRDAPILLLCMARPELLDERPGWGSGKLNAANVLLEPLGLDESRELIDALLPQAIDAALRERILASAAGNPLFVEEMVAMIDEDDRGVVSVPPSIHALLAARLDQLDTVERSVLERGSVEGQVFHRGAVVALAPAEETTVVGPLVALVRKDLVRPERATLSDDEAFRFRHLLIRDTAYEALPKSVRAALHERFADWLQAHADNLIESDELVGYHLQQAHRYRRELGPLDETARALARRGAEHLLASAERAQARGDSQAGRTLLTQAVELLPADDPGRRAAQVDLAVILARSGESDQAAALREEAVTAARAAGDDRLLARVKLAEVEAAILHDPTATIRDGLANAEQAIDELERIGDDEGAAWGLRVAGNLNTWLGNTGESLQLWERALERAKNVSPRLQNDVLFSMTWTLWLGPTPAEEGIRRCDEVIRDSTSKRVEATALVVRGNLKALTGRIDEGREDAAAGRLLFQELGDQVLWAASSQIEAHAELSAGTAERAYELLAEAQEALTAGAGSGLLVSIVAMRAHAALELDRDDEALELAEETGRTAAPDDLEPHVTSRLVRARVLARRGDLAAADELLREAGEIVDPTDYAILHLELALAQADVARVASRSEDERQALERAAEVAEAKGNAVAAERARGRLDEAPAQA